MKVSRPMLYTLLAALVVAAWVVASEDPSASKTKSAGVGARSRSSTKETPFTEEDHKARYSRVNEPTKNAFKPIVARLTAAGGGVMAPDAVPADLAGGDPNWFYTGTAIVDGVPTALMENRATLEGEFVKHGQAWKRAKVAQIGPDALVLTGATGRQYTLRLAMPSYDEVTGSPIDGLRPLQPLSGPIGGNVAIQPEAPRNRNDRISNPETRDAN